VTIRWRPIRVSEEQSQPCQRLSYTRIRQSSRNCVQGNFGAQSSGDAQSNGARHLCRFSVLSVESSAQFERQQHFSPWSGI